MFCNNNNNNNSNNNNYYYYLIFIYSNVLILFLEVINTKCNLIDIIINEFQCLKKKFILKVPNSGQ